MPPEPKAPLFSEPGSTPKANPRLLLIAVCGVVAVFGSGIALLRSHPSVSPVNTVAPLDAYASSLSFENITLSEAGHGTGTKSLYVDGIVKNNGPKTLTALTVQVLFHAGDASTASLQTIPLALIRTHEPYVDLQPISAAPIAPGGSAEFRLIFEGIPDTWDTQPPQIRPIRSTEK
jgi:hypothetical protein